MSTHLAPLPTSELSAAEAIVERTLGGRRQVRLDRVIDVLDGPELLGAWEDTALVGVACWLGEESVELAALGVAPGVRGRGVGAALLDAVVAAARHGGAREVWLVTTNDNLTALGLYQRHGFRITRVVRGGVDRARKLKPEIPLVADNGIPVHDELVLSHTF
jgi:ribosomal protein S18 acetylase RimI-like enzyme